MNPSPCPHPVHLACLGKRHSHAKDFTCHRCVPLVSLMRKISGLEADVDIRKELNAKLGSQPKNKSLDASDSVRLQRLEASDSYEMQLEASKLKCVMLVESENSDLLLEAEFLRTRMAR